MEELIKKQQKQISELEELFKKLTVIVCKKQQPAIDQIVGNIRELNNMSKNIDQIVANTNTIIDNFEKGKQDGDEKQQHYIG
jgi:t-SNARE complex subunit (syntaxin)